MSCRIGRRPSVAAACVPVVVSTDGVRDVRRGGYPPGTSSAVTGREELYPPRIKLCACHHVHSGGDSNTMRRCHACDPGMPVISTCFGFPPQPPCVRRPIRSPPRSGRPQRRSDLPDCTRHPRHRSRHQPAVDWGKFLRSNNPAKAFDRGGISLSVSWPRRLTGMAYLKVVRFWALHGPGMIARRHYLLPVLGTLGGGALAYAALVSPTMSSAGRTLEVIFIGVGLCVGWYQSLR